MKLHSFGRILSLVAMLALMFALTFAVSVTANAEAADPAPVAQSEELIITTPDLAEPMCGKVKFAWNTVDGATTYRVYIDGKHTINMEIGNAVLDELYYILSDLTIGKEYNFTVDAVAANGEVLASGTYLYTPEHAWNETLYEIEPGTCWRVYYCIFDNCDEIAHVAEIHESVNHVEAVDPTCCQNGNVEYWYCSDCNKVWLDEARTQLTNFKRIVLPYDVDNVEHFEKVENGCHWNGMNEYWHCTKCDAVYADATLDIRSLTNRKNLVIPMTASLVHVEALDVTCCQNGNVEHWYCTGDCQGVWTDAELTQITNHKSVVIPHSVDNVAYVAKVDAGCHQNGMNEYWYCKECDAVYSEATLDIRSLTNRKNLVIPYDSENVLHVDKVEAGCHQNGMNEYWHCTVCDAIFTDAALKQLTNIKNLVIPYDADNIKKIDALDPTCHQNGNVEYWYCVECDAVFTDAALTQLSNRKNVVIPCTAEIGHEAAIAVTCHTNGRLEFWYCTECDAVFTDVLRTQLSNRKSVVIPYDRDNIVHVDAVEVGCHQNGNIEYWYCKKCPALFSDSNLENEIDTATIKYNAENVVHVAKVEPGCHQNGCEEYWRCTVCDAVFSDEDLEYLTNVKNLTIPYTAEIGHEDAIAVQCHINGRREFWFCTECDAVFTDMALTELSSRKGVVIPYDVDNVLHVSAKDPSCHQTGCIEYWHCIICDDIYTDATLTTVSTLERVTIPFNKETNIAHVDAVAAGCHATGMLEYWYCIECDAIFTDADLTKLSNRKSIITPYTAEIIHITSIDATCTTDGNIEYWQCSECAATFSNATLKTPVDEVVIAALGHKWQNATCTEYETCKVCQATYGAPLGHTLVDLPSTDATCTEDGITAGKKCTVCGEITVKQEVIEALGHNYELDTDPNKILLYQVCTHCGEQNPEEHDPKFQFTETLKKITIVAACALVIILLLRALFRPATTTRWYRRRR